MQRNATTTGSANSAEAGDGTVLFDSNRYSRTLREFYIFLYPYIMLWPQSGSQHSWIDNCICSAFRRFNLGLWQHCLGMKLSKFVRLYVYDCVKKVPCTWQPELAMSVCQKVLARNSRELFLFVQELVLFRLPVELSFIHATTQRTESSCEVSQSLSGVSPVLRREPNLDAFLYPLDLPLLHF